MFTHFGNRCQSPLIAVSSTTPINTKRNSSLGGITFTVMQLGGSPTVAVSTVLMGSASYEACFPHLAYRHQAA